MKFFERALIFECDGEELVGVLAEPESPGPVAVLIIVGGPQYRVGSHRQFVLLARRLAEEGIPVMRFDYRGMGDAMGRMQTFESAAPDIAAAVESLLSASSSVEKVVLWGLCDAASAGLMYLQATRDARIAGLVLANPWVRSQTTLAKTHVKHYYGKRLLDREFWAKMTSGRINVVGAVGTFLRSLRGALGRPNPESVRGGVAFQDLMLEGMRGFSGPVLIILSGRDLTASEFADFAQADAQWRRVLSRSNIDRYDASEADHTFSSAVLREGVETRTLLWLRERFPDAAR